MPHACLSGKVNDLSRLVLFENPGKNTLGLDAVLDRYEVRVALQYATSRTFQCGVVVVGHGVEPDNPPALFQPAL